MPTLATLPFFAYLCSHYHIGRNVMKHLFLKSIGGHLLGIVTAVLLVACQSDKNKADSTAKAFLQAYYIDLDFSKAIQLSTPVSFEIIKDHAQLVALNPYAQEEIPNIVFGTIILDNNNSNLGTYSYTCNRVDRTLPLIKKENKWLVNLENRTVESEGLFNSLTNVSSSGTNGFASSTSGDISHKKRKTSKKQ